jgi:hypothetical protein
LAVIAACNGKGCGKSDACPLTIADANDYDYTAALTLDSINMAALTDGTLDWSQLTTDYRGRPAGPVNKVTIGKIDMLPDAMLQAIDTNTLLQSDIVTYYEVDDLDGTVSSVKLSDFSVIGNQFNPQDDSNVGWGQSDTDTWIATIWTLDTRNIYEIMSSLIIVPVDGETNTTASFTDTSASLDFSVDLQSLAPVQVDPECTDYTLDWSGVTTDVNGADFNDLLADTLRIAHFQGDITDVESQFLELDLAADETYFLTVFGQTSAPSDTNPKTLLDAQSPDGSASFGGFTSDGVWLVDLECTQQSCFSPAPLLLTTVEAR